MIQKIVFYIEKVPEGYRYCVENSDKSMVMVGIDSVPELMFQLEQVCNLCAENAGQAKITEDMITVKYDLPALFDFYKEVNWAALSRRIGISKSMLSHYKNGHRQPSPKQLHRILAGIHELGQELSKLNLII